MDKRLFDEFRNSASILVVDDAVSIRAQLRAMLRDQGIDEERILVAEDGTEALDLYHAHDPDLVLLDVNLPDKPGWEVGPEMLEARPNANIALLTGLQPDHERVRELVSSGVVDVLEKPLREGDLRNLLLLVARRFAETRAKSEGGFFGQASA